MIAPLASTFDERFHRGTLAAIVCAILVMAFALVAGSLPWWALKAEYEPGSYGPTSMTLLYSPGRSCGAPTGFSYFFACSDATWETSAGALLVATGTLNTVAGVLAFLMLLFLILGAFWPKLGTISTVTGIAGAILYGISPVLLFAALPSAVASQGEPFEGITGFYGSHISGTATFTYGAGAGWYFALIVTAFYFLAAGLTAVAMRRIRPLGNVRLPTVPVLVYAPPMPQAPPPAPREDSPPPPPPS